MFPPDLLNLDPLDKNSSHAVVQYAHETFEVFYVIRDWGCATDICMKYEYVCIGL